MYIIRFFTQGDESKSSETCQLNACIGRQIFPATKTDKFEDQTQHAPTQTTASSLVHVDNHLSR